MAKILENITLENYRGHKATSIKKINNLLMLVGKNDIGKSSVLEALNVFFNTDKINDSDYCQTNNASELSIKCKINGKKYELKADKNARRKSYSIDGSQFPDRDSFEDDIHSIHYTLFKADDTKVSGHEGESVANFIQNLQNEDTYKKFFKDNGENISFLVNNTLLIAESFRKLKEFFLQNDMQEYYDYCNDQKKFAILENDKNILLSKLRSFHFSDHQIETNKEKLFLNLLKKTTIYNPSVSPRTISIKVDPNSPYYDRFRQWFIAPTLEDITESTLDRRIVQAYEKEQSRHLKPFYEIESVLDTFMGDLSPIENRGSGVKRLCAFYQFAIHSKTVFETTNDQYILAVEEPEISLHPNQQRKFIQQLRKITYNSDTQVIATTHSPYIVNELRTGDVCILKRKFKEENGHIIRDANGLPIELDEITTKALDNRILTYLSMAEINYLAFDEPSITYHQELYGQIEVECMGESNGCKINQIINAIWRDRNNVLYDLITDFNRQPDRPFEVFYDNNLYSSPDGNIPNRDVLVVPYCVRNAIDHPGNMNKQWKNNISVVDLSIKMLIEIYKAVEKAENSFLPTINSKTSDLDDYGHETFKCSGASDNNEHSLTYWVKYQIDHPNECLIRQNRRGQDNPNGEIKNKINFVKAMYDIDPDWLTK